MALDVLHALRPRARAVSDVDLLIRGDERDLAVADGRIVAVGPELGGPAREEVDARGLLVLPGVVDAHVHLNEPGRADWEGFATGTAALAAGGTTCAIDMPLNAMPPTIDGAAFDAKVAAATGVARVDFALWGGLVPGDLDRLDELAARGVVGFKAFMSASGVQEFEAADDLTLLEGMAARGAPRPAGRRARRERGAHEPAGAPGRGRGPGRRARLPGLAAGARRARGHRPRDRLRRRDRLRAARRPRLERPRRRPRGAGAGARGRRDVRDVPALPGARRATTPSASAPWPSARRRCAARDEREALWAALRAGDVDLVATDHSPAPAALKAGRRLLRRVGRDRRRPDAAGAALRRGRRRPAASRRHALADAARRGAGAALRPGAGQGRARGRRRRRRGARRPGGDVDGGARGAARPPPAEPVRRPRRCAAAWCARSCAGARSRSTGGPSASPAGAWCARGA